MNNPTLAKYLSDAARYRHDDDLVLRHLLYVVSIAKRYAYNSDDLLDLIQVGNIGLINAAATWDEQGSFPHWANLHVRSSIRNYLFGADALSTYTRSGGAKLPTEEVLDDRHVDQGIELYVSDGLLSARQCHVLRGRLQGYTHGEIARGLSVTRQAVQQQETAAVQLLAEQFAQAN